MEESEMEDIEKLIDKRIKVMFVSIEMLQEDMNSVRKTINRLYYFLVGLFAVGIFIGAIF
jgi:hypothetical protein